MKLKTKIRIGTLVLVLLTLGLLIILGISKFIENRTDKEIEQTEEENDDLAEVKPVITEIFEEKVSTINDEYSNIIVADENLSIDYPKSWENEFTKQDGANSRLIIKSSLENSEDEVMENFQIVFEENLLNEDLQTNYNKKLAEISASQFFAEKVEEKDIQIAGVSAKSVEYKFNVATEAVEPVVYYLRVQSVVFIKDNKIINIIFSGQDKDFDANREIISNVLNSIK